MSLSARFTLMLSLLAVVGLRPAQPAPVHLQHLVSRSAPAGPAVNLVDAPDSVVAIAGPARFSLGAIGLLVVQEPAFRSARLDRFSRYIRPPPSY